MMMRPLPADGPESHDQLDAAMAFAFAAPGPKTQAEERPYEAAPEQVGRYRLIEEVGRGGMGSVWRAQDLELDRLVAIKILRDGGTSATSLRRFAREARITSRLQHPSIVPVHDFGTTEDGRPWLCLRLVEGETLRARLARRHEIGEDSVRLLSVLEQVARAVGYAHARGVVHRDLKPANIILGSYGEVQVMDWGLAVEMDEDQHPEEEHLRSPDQELSRPGAILGTLSYMSPEQARGDRSEVDRRADVFALGAMLLEVLDGEEPYRGLSGEAVLTAAQDGQWEHRARTLDADPLLRNLVVSCLQTEPLTRPSDATVVAEEIASYLAHLLERRQRADLQAAEARAEARQERRVRRSVTLAGSAVVFGLCATFGLLLWRNHERERDATRVQEALQRVERGALSAETEALSATDTASALEAWNRAVAEAGEGVGLVSGRGFELEERVRSLLKRLTRQRDLATEEQGMSQLRVELVRATRSCWESWHGEEADGVGLDMEAPSLLARLGIQVDDPDLGAAQIRGSPLAVPLTDLLLAWRVTNPPGNLGFSQWVDATLRLVAVDPWLVRLLDATPTLDEATLTPILDHPLLLLEGSETTLALAGFACSRLRTPAATVPFLESGLRRFPNSISLHVRVVNEMQHLLPVPYERLIARCSTLVALAPESWKYRLQLIRILVRSQRLDEARAWLETPGSVSPPGDRDLIESWIARRRGDLVGAVAALRRAAAAKPPCLRAMVELAEVACLAGRFAEGRALYEAVYAQTPQNPAVLHGLARLEAADKKWQSALRFAESALGQTHRNPDLWRDAGELALMAGNPARSVDCGGEAYRRAGPDRRMAGSFAYLLMRATRIEEALAVLDRAQAQDPTTQEPSDAARVRRECLRSLEISQLLQSAHTPLKYEQFAPLFEEAISRDAHGDAAAALRRWLPQLSPDSLDGIALRGRGAEVLMFRAFRQRGADPEAARQLRREAWELVQSALGGLERLEQDSGYTARLRASRLLGGLPVRAGFSWTQFEPLEPSEQAEWDELWRRCEEAAAQ